MAEAFLDIVVNDSGLDKLREASELVRDLADNYDELDESAIDAAADLAKSNGELSDSIEDANKEASKQIAIQKESAATAKNSAKEFKVFGKSIGDYQAQLGEYTTRLKGVIAPMRGATSASKLLGLAMKAIPIFALIAAFTSLIAFFTRTQKGADLLQRATAALGAAMEVLFDVAEGVGELLVKAFSDPQKTVEQLGETIKTVLYDQTIGRIESLGKVISLVFKGEFREAAKEAADVLTGVNNAVDKGTALFNAAADATKALVDEIVEEVKATDLLTLAKQRLRDRNVEFIKTQADLRAIIEENRAVSNDQSKAFEVREAAALKAAEAEKTLVSQRLALARENVRIIAAENALSNNLTADNERLAQAQANVANIRAESSRLERRLINELNVIRKQQLAQIEAIKKSYAELVGSLQSDLAAIDLENADPLTKLQLQQRTALLAIEDQIEQYKETALLLGISPEEQAEVLAGYQKLIDGIRSKFSDEITNLLTPEDLALPGFTLPELELPRVDLDSIEDVFSINEAFNSIQDGVNALNLTGPFSELDEALQKIQDGNYFEGFQIAANIATQSIVDGINRQIAAIDSQIAKQEEKVNKTRELLDEELADQEKGYANNVAEVENQLQAEEEALQASNDRKAELEKKAAIASAINDTIQQSQNLITAGTGIFKAFSSIPFVGVPLAIAAIGAMLGAFAKLKIDAIGATTALEAGTVGEGNSVSDYFAADGAVPNGRSDKNGQKAYRLYDEVTGKDMGVRFSGKEGILDEESTKFFSPLVKHWKKYGELPISGISAVSDQADSIGSTNVFVAGGGISKQEYKEVLKEIMNENLEGHKSIHKGKADYAVSIGDGKVLVRTGNHTQILTIDS